MKLLLLLGVAVVAVFAQQQEAAVSDFKVGVLEKGDEPTGLKTVVLFSKLSGVLTVPSNNRLYLSFAVNAKAGGAKLKPHQVFVILQHVKTSADIIFVADAQKDGTYTADIDLNKVSTDFGGLSGLYHARLVVGDAKIKNPIDWLFSDVDITVPAVVAAPVKKSEQVILSPLPEISHQFRAPEKRPPGVVSDAFTLLCLSPVLVLVFLWFKMGVNVSNMPLSPWTLLFHAGLAGIFGLYFVFWVQLNMFETLKYLAFIGSATFFAGNRLLKAIASRRKEKTN